MATPSASASGDSTPAPTSFSYAQAAKGKSTPSTSTVAQASSKLAASEKIDAQSTERSSWAEEPASTDAVLTNGAPPGTQSKPHAPEITRTDSGTTQNDSTWSTSHEEVSGKANKESTQDQRSIGTSETESQSAGDSSSRKEGPGEKKSDRPVAEIMKEAPPPPINIWAQRAQDAKAKQVKPAGASTSVESSASAPNAKAAAPAVSAAAEAVTEEGAATRASASKPSASRNTDGRGAPRSGEKVAKTAPLPSVSDATLWPTPLTAQSAQEQERKKAHEKSDKPSLAETERPVTKTHKNEWVPVPFTPTVKFETPMPGTTRRPGRPAGRGGRGGASANFSERHGRPGAAAEGANDGQEAEESNVSRSSSLPTKAKRAAGQTGNDSSVGTEQPKRGSLQEESSGVKAATPASSANANRATSEATKFTPAAASSSDAKESADSAPSSRPKRVDAAAADMVNGTEAVKPQAKGKTARSDANAHTAHEGEDRRKDDAPSYTGKPAPSFRKSEAGRDGSPPQRGGREGRRGRGGRGGIFTGPNGHSQMSGQGPKSATFASQYSQYPPFLPNVRGGGNYRSNGPRSASIPSGFGPGFPYNSGLEYDLANAYGLGVPATQFSGNNNNNNLELIMLSNGVSQQLTYYFSLDNLLKDTFLRSNMDSQGFVSLQLIADFKRMKTLTADVSLLRQVCLQTPALELRAASDGTERVRIREGWEKWVLPMEERQEAARNDGPPHPERNASSRGPMSPNNMPFSPDGFYSPPFGGMMPPFAPMNMGAPMNGFAGGKGSHNRHSVGGMPMADYYGHPPFVMPNGSHHSPSDEADSFPDASVNALTVVVRPQNESVHKPLNLDSRTFSNGSLDAEALESAAAADKSHDGSNGTDERSEKIAELRRTLTNHSHGKAKQDVALFWIKEKDSPETIPEGTVTEPYTHLRAKALQQRETAEEGECPYDLEVLYQFWSHFLVRNYNGDMYNEFRKLAHEDASLRAANKGMHNLIQYYGHSLSSQHTIRQNVLQHYIELVKNEDPGKDRLAFKQLRNAWRDGSLNFRNRKRLLDVLDPELKAELER